MTPEEKAKAYDEALERASKLRFQNPFDTVSQMMEHVFPELQESEDERIRKELIAEVKDQIDSIPAPDCRDKEDEKALKQLNKWLAWLERQSKPKWTEEDSLMIDSIIDTIKWLEGKGATNMKIDWLKSLKQRIHVSSAKNCKNDTILDLLQKMPSYITVDGKFYHFILRKTTISYMAFYEGEGECSGKVIFWVTAFSPIELLTAMLEKLKKEGLLE